MTNKHGHRFDTGAAADWMGLGSMRVLMNSTRAHRCRHVDGHHRAGSGERLPEAVTCHACQSDRHRTREPAFTPVHHHMEWTSEPQRHHQTPMSIRLFQMGQSTPPDRPLDRLQAPRGSRERVPPVADACKQVLPAVGPQGWAPVASAGPYTVPYKAREGRVRGTDSIPSRVKE